MQVPAQNIGEIYSENNMLKCLYSRGHKKAEGCNQSIGHQNVWSAAQL